MTTTEMSRKQMSWSIRRYNDELDATALRETVDFVAACSSFDEDAMATSRWRR
jgi:hypothetical protein